MRLFIYVENEEMADLKPLARRLEKKTGGVVKFYALRFMDNDVRADQILTLPHHLDKVKELFKDTGIPVKVIEQDAVAPEAEPVIVAAEPTTPVLVVPEVAEPEEIVLPPVQETDEVVVMTVAEEPAPAPAPRARRAKS